MEILSRGALWSPSRQQLIFTFRDDNNEIILAQGRNFHPLAKSRYQTYGSPEDCLPIYYQNKETEGNNHSNTRALVVVEDCLSAIKIARQSDSMPVLSSDLSRTKLKRLARQFGAFLVWLDSDMYHKAQRIAQRLEFLGCEAKAVWTPLDPKEYSDKEISNVLLTGRLES